MQLPKARPVMMALHTLRLKMGAQGSPPVGEQRLLQGAQELQQSSRHHCGRQVGRRQNQARLCSQACLRSGERANAARCQGLMTRQGHAVLGGPSAGAGLQLA